MIRSIQDLIRLIKYRILYPNSHICFGASLRGRVLLRQGVRIEKGTYVHNSFLGQKMIVHQKCYVSNSYFEGETRICNGCVLNDVHIGRYTYICEESRLSKVHVGRFCSIGFQVILGRGVHPTDFLSSSPVFFSSERQCGISFTDKDYFEERRTISIGHDVWIGDRVFVRDGVRIGHGAIIGAGAIVVKDVPDYAIFAGVPAVLIRFRFPEKTISELLNTRWWDWDEESLKKAQGFFVRKDIDGLINWAYSNK